MGAAAVTTRASLYTLDVTKLEYIPPPPKPTWFDEELKRLMPLNPMGESFLKLEWGMDAVCFRNGDPNAIKYIAAHEKLVVRRYRRLDPIAGKFEYFNTREEAVNAVNIRLLPTIDYKNFNSVKHWGPPRWILSGWLPAERFGTAEMWQLNRHATVKLRGGHIVKLDALGPYPSRGQYRSVWTIEGPENTFRDLDRGVMTEIERLVSEHKKAASSENGYADGQQIRDFIAERFRLECEEQARVEEEFLEDHLGPSRYRLIEGNAWSGYTGGATWQPPT